MLLPVPVTDNEDMRKTRSTGVPEQFLEFTTGSNYMRHRHYEAATDNPNSLLFGKQGGYRTQCNRALIKKDYPFIFVYFRLHPSRIFSQNRNR